MPQILRLEDASSLPRWRQPVALLFAMAFAMPLAFATWSALLNNFVIEVAGFTGVEIGWLHTVREIPGFLAIAVILLIMLMREQTLALGSLVLLGVASAVTAFFPSFGGLMLTTFVASIGFHYYETAAQSLQLQWLDKREAPKILGWIVGIGSGASLLAYGLLVVTWKAFELSYSFVYMTSGGLCVAIAVFCWLAYPQFEAPTPQRKEFVLRRRYWLY
jgi:hypothetical protein